MMKTVTYNRSKIMKLLNPKVSARFAESFEFKNTPVWECKMARMITAGGLGWLKHLHADISEGMNITSARRDINVYFFIVDIARQVDCLYMTIKKHGEDPVVYKMLNKLLTSWENLDDNSRVHFSKSFYTFMHFVEFDMFNFFKTQKKKNRKA